MLFTSFEFLILLFITYVVYYLPLSFFKKANTQIIVLIGASLFFYGYYDPALLFLLFFSGAVNVITSYYVTYGPPKYRYMLAFIGIVINLSVIAFFKYSPLVAVTFFDTSNGVGHFLLTIPLPIGISFFTFEGISLVIDTYKAHDEINLKTW